MDKSGIKRDNQKCLSRGIVEILKEKNELNLIAKCDEGKNLVVICV